MRRSVGIIAVISAVWSAGALWAQGYRIEGNQVAIDRAAEWEAWTFAAGTVEISGTGAVEPHFVHKNTDATRDILTHLRRNPPSGLQIRLTGTQNASPRHLPTRVLKHRLKPLQRRSAEPVR